MRDGNQNTDNSITVTTDAELKNALSTRCERIVIKGELAKEIYTMRIENMAFDSATNVLFNIISIPLKIGALPKISANMAAKSLTKDLDRYKMIYVSKYELNLILKKKYMHKR